MLFARQVFSDSTKCIFLEKTFFTFFESIFSASTKSYLKPDSKHGILYHIN